MPLCGTPAPPSCAGRDAGAFVDMDVSARKIFAERFNDAHGRCRHVFQGRCRATIVQKNTYRKELARYVVLNPVRAGMVGLAQDWPWGSDRATTGEAHGPDWLRRDCLLAAFGATQQAAAAIYRQCVSDGGWPIPALGGPAPAGPSRLGGVRGECPPTATRGSGPFGDPSRATPGTRQTAARVRQAASGP